jgi:hypothetical protein
MSDLTLDTLTRRLDLLEREAKRWKILASIELAAFALAVLLWPAVGTLQEVQERILAKEIKANEALAARFALTDKSGARHGALSILPDGSVGLGLSAPDGKTASLSGDVGGRTGLTLYDNNRKLLQRCT